jgi:hypothetical protein
LGGISIGADLGRQKVIFMTLGYHE